MRLRRHYNPVSGALMPLKGRKCARDISGGFRSLGERYPWPLAGAGICPPCGRTHPLPLAAGICLHFRAATSRPPRRRGPCKREKAADGPSGHPGCSRLQPLRKQAFDGPETKTAGRFRDQLPFPFAEEGGFEPPIPREGYTGFRDQRLQPLGHPSLGIAKIYKKNKLTKRQRVL